MGPNRSDASVIRRQLPVEIDERLLERFVAIGRTEDVAVSADGHRLAIAGFFSDVVALLDVELDEPAVVRVTRVTTLRSDTLSQPHGLAFVDDSTLLVANRDGALVALRVPAVDELVDDELDDLVVESRVVADRSSAVPVWGPGSVVVRPVGGDLFEAIVCNNHAHQVNRYLLDRRHDLAVVDQEVLVGSGLQVPDGLAMSPSGEWLALSNHETHEVFVYRYGPELRADATPTGVLRGANYPHGMQFVDDRHLLVTDAGLPFVYAFAVDDGDWSGPRAPVHVARVMDDETFNTGRYNPREGGPKGMVIMPGGGPVVLTSEHQKLACFLPADLLGPARADPVPPVGPGAVARTALLRLALRSDEHAADADRLRSEVGALTERAAAVAEQLDEATARALAAEEEADRRKAVEARLRSDLGAAAGAADAWARQVALLHATRSWRITAPLRRAGDALRAIRRRHRR